MEENTEDYGSFSVYDLIDDRRFIQWVLSPTALLDQYWKKAIDQYPNLSLVVPQARKLLVSIKFQQTDFPKEREDRLWMVIKANAIPAKPKGRIFSFWMRGVAAACIGALVVFSILYLSGDKSVSAPYGEIKNVVLPDGSAVTLNANSHLKFKRFWKEKNIREVWLTGEAFFNIKHLHIAGKIEPGDRFIVHAGLVNIEVLGTSFNVNHRHNIVNVALLTGKISMSTVGQGKRPIIMRPGDVLEYQQHQDTIIHKNVKSARKAAWKDKILVFEGTPASEVFSQLEDIYGYKVVVRRSGINNRKVSGSFNMANEANLIKAISLALNVTIEKDEVKHQFIIQ